MESYKTMAAVYVACLLLLVGTDGQQSCVQTVTQESGYSDCVAGYSSFILNAASSMDPSDPMGMLIMLCSAEGKQAMQCITGYLKRCPALKTDGATAQLFSSLSALDQFGGLDGYCKTVSGLSGMVTGDPCIAVSQCMQSQQFTNNGENLDNLPIPVLVIQPGIGTLCGPLKGMFECLADAGDQCSHLGDKIKKMLNLGRSEAPPGSTLPDFDTVKMFVKNECPKIPADFSTNTCVKNQMMSQEFAKCFEQVAKVYPSDTVSCDAYRAGYKCTENTVGKNCGSKYLNVIGKVSHMFIAGAPSECKLTTSGTGNVQLSIVAVVLAFFLARVWL